MFETSERMPRNQPPTPTSVSDSTGRIACRATLAPNSRLKPCGRFMAEPPVIGSTGQTKPKTMRSTSATM